MKDLDFFEATLIVAGYLIPLVFAKLNFGIFTISIVDVIVVLMAVGFIVRVRTGWLADTGVGKLFFILVVWAAFSIPQAIDPTKTWREFIWLLESFLVFYMVSQGVNEQTKIERLLKSWCYSAFTVAMLGILLCFSGLRWEGQLRNISTLCNPNSLSGYLILYIPILVAFKYNKTPVQKLYWGILVTVITTALVLTYTRGGWLAAIISITMMAALLYDKRLMVLLAVYLLTYNFAFQQVGDRAATIVESVSNISSKTPTYTSSSHRLQLWRVGLKMWQDHPVTGVGVGNYYHFYNSYNQGSPSGMRFEAMEPHNSFIKFLSETGIIGLGLFVAILISIMCRIIVLLRQVRNRNTYIMLVGMACGGLAFIVQSNTNSLFHDARVAFGFWMVTGLMLSVVGKKVSSPQGNAADRWFAPNQKAGLGTNA